MVNQHGDPQTRVADTESDDRHSPTAQVRTESDNRQNRDGKEKAADRQSVCPECDGRLITSDSQRGSFRGDGKAAVVRRLRDLG